MPKPESKPERRESETASATPAGPSPAPEVSELAPDANELSLERERTPQPRYRLRAVTTPVPARADGSPASSAEPVQACPEGSVPARSQRGRDPFLRPATEDDDGYDPFSDRPPTPEPVFEERPWD